MTQDKDWINSTNVYEVNLRQYTPEGTINAFAAHLPRLKDMGVQILWFMPITPIADKYKKGTLGSYYACSHYTDVNPEFGTLEDFKTLVKTAHNLGFRIIIDWVANHTGWDHVWTIEHPEWYKRDEATGEFIRASGMDDIIELDFKNHELRKAMISAMKFWVVETGIDGFRCDLAFWVQLDFWVEAQAELHAEKKLFWLAESDPLVHPEYMQVFDSAYTWTWMSRTEAFYREGLLLHDLLPVLDQYQQSPGIKAWFTSNHDENSWNGTEFEKYGDAAALLAVFSCTWPGIPLIYSGQELPNRKRLMFFDKDPIHWRDPVELHDFFRSLLQLKAGHQALRADAGVYRVHTSGDEKVLSYLRKANDMEVWVMLNFSPVELGLEVFDLRIKGKFRELFSGMEADLDQYRKFRMGPWSYMVFTNLQVS